MNISYGKVCNEIFKILNGVGQRVRMYDEDGNGPIATAWHAKYIYAEPTGIMITVPQGRSSEYDEIYVYRGKDIDFDQLKNIFDRIQTVAHQYNIGVTLRTFESNIAPKDFAYRIWAKNQEKQYAANESAIPSLRNYLHE